jgi:hypothetical protein
MACRFCNVLDGVHRELIITLATRGRGCPLDEVEAEVTRANRGFRKSPERDMERSGSGNAATCRSIASSEAPERSGEEFCMKTFPAIIFARLRLWPTAAAAQ